MTARTLGPDENLTENWGRLKGPGTGLVYRDQRILRTRPAGMNNPRSGVTRRGSMIAP
jgi:hypothetical protein